MEENKVEEMGLEKLAGFKEVSLGTDSLFSTMGGLKRKI